MVYFISFHTQHCPVACKAKSGPVNRSQLDQIYGCILLLEKGEVGGGEGEELPTTHMISNGSHVRHAAGKRLYLIHENIPLS